MARRARMIIPGVAHHVTQRGNRSERIFLEDGDDRSISTCRHNNFIGIAWLAGLIA
jgi:hypothetical protein